ncbi:MAG: putative CRISPR-associated protein [Candidatus Riflebacteria bacterium]|nr:putative CRISPR-associated protein [Candidatus Riflebacteria bacterium]
MKPSQACESAEAKREPRHPVHFVVTVGTSLLTGPDRPWRWRAGEDLPARHGVVSWLRQSNPVKASAELNTLHRIREEGDLGSGDRVTLVHTETDDGHFCAVALFEHLETVGRAHGIREVRLRAVDGLTHDPMDFGRHGLRSLARVLFDLVRDDRIRSRPTCATAFVATGGFKPESAYCALVGALTRSTVYYVHERFARLVRIPPLPVAWDTTLIEENRDFVDWIEVEPRPAADVKRRLKSARDLAPYVEFPGDGHGYLSPVGLMLLEACTAATVKPGPVRPLFRDARPVPEKNLLSGLEHHRPHGLDDLVERLCALDWVSQVRASPADSGSSGTALIDPESGEFRAAYRCGDESLGLRILTMARTKPERDWVQCEIERLLEEAA